MILQSKDRNPLWVGMLILIIAALMAGCAQRSQTLAATATSASSTITVTVTPSYTSTTTPIPSAASPTLTQTPAANQTAAPATPSSAALERTKTSRLPSGWTIFSNPDFVQGVAVHDRLLWAATLGGVVAWNLDTKEPTLYTTRDGLVEIQGNDVVYCSMPEERILVAHATGMLSAYNLALQKWSRIPITFDDGTTLRGVQTLFCDSANQRLIVGSADGLGILSFETGHWRRYGPKEGLKVDSVRGIDVVGQAIWVAAGDKSAFMIMGNTVFPFDSASGFPTGSVNDLSVAPDMSIWFGYSTGLVHYQDKRWNSYGAQAASGIPFLSVDHVVVGPNKQIWIASAEEGVCPFNSVTLFCSTIYPGNRGTPITDLAVGDNGVAYAGTSGGGVLVFNEDQVEHLRFHTQQLSSNDVWDITGSPDGNLWVSTGNEINYFNPVKASGGWQSLTQQRDQMDAGPISGLLPTANGMWFFYEKEPLASYYDGSSWLKIDAQEGLSGPVLDAVVDQRGYVWFATSKAINLWDGTVLRSYSPTDSLPGNAFNAVMERDDGIWVGSSRGLLHYQRYQWQVALPEIPINAIAPDSNGGLLLGTDEGLMRFDGSQTYLWVINLGKEIVFNPKITSIARDGNGQLWVGTAGHGLFHYDGKHWEQFDTTNGLPTNTIRKVFADWMGAIWIAAATGEGGGALVRYVP